MTLLEIPKLAVPAVTPCLFEEVRKTNIFKRLIIADEWQNLIWIFFSMKVSKQNLVKNFKCSFHNTDHKFRFFSSTTFSAKSIIAACFHYWENKWKKKCNNYILHQSLKGASYMPLQPQVVGNWILEGITGLEKDWQFY